MIELKVLGGGASLGLPGWVLRAVFCILIGQAEGNEMQACVGERPEGHSSKPRAAAAAGELRNKSSPQACKERCPAKALTQDAETISFCCQKPLVCGTFLEVRGNPMEETEICTVSAGYWML